MVSDNESEVMSECDKLFNYSACSYVNEPPTPARVFWLVSGKSFFEENQVEFISFFLAEIPLQS